MSKFILSCVVGALTLILMFYLVVLLSCINAENAKTICFLAFFSPLVGFVILENFK